MKRNTTLDLTGMYCAACAGRIEKVLAKMPGVESAYVNFATERATVTHDDDAAAVEKLITRVADAGYGAAVRPSAASRRGRGMDAEEAARRRQARRPGATRGGVGRPCRDHGVPGHAAHDRHRSRRTRPLAPVDGAGGCRRSRRGAVAVRRAGDTLRWLSFALTLPIVLWAGRDIYRAAWNGARHRTADMNTLIAVGTGAAFAQSLAATIGARAYERACLPPDVYWGVSGVDHHARPHRAGWLESRARGRGRRGRYGDSFGIDTPRSRTSCADDR